MKLISAIVVTVAVLGAGAWYVGTRPAPQPASRPAARGDALGVHEIMRDADRHRGSVSVVGVVATASADKQLVTLIDAKEFAACNSTGCAELVLPVRWRGAMPAVAKTVHVEGQVQESDGKLVFVASALQELNK
ncbi:hypothetical protein [Fontivita pretiosa]|uniref:hypothetical protein n=1 Tax=Fontivita pretiosa TaxID=2989684 RepID=UPI003D16C07E